jgi:hypothetical protein
MPYSVNDDLIRLDFKENPVVSDSQAILGSKVREPLHIAGQVIPHGLDFLDDPPRHRLRERLEILDRSGLEVDLVRSRRSFLKLRKFWRMFSIHCRELCGSSPSKNARRTLCVAPWYHWAKDASTI